MRKAVLVCLAIFLLLMLIFTGCQRSSVIDPRIRQAVSNTSRSEDAIDWLILNGDLVIPELMSRLSGGSNARANEAAQAILVMGDHGRRSLLKYYPTLSAKGKERAIDMLAKEQTKESALQLMALSRQADSFDQVVTALYSMGDLTLHYFVGQLHSEHYKDVVNATLAAFSEDAVPLLLNAVNSNDTAKSERALTILSQIGAPAVAPLIANTLDQAATVEKSTRIAQIMLKSFPTEAAQAIIDTATLGIGYPEVAAAMLYELGEENLSMVLSTRSSNGTEKALVTLLDHYIEKIGITKVLQLALSNPGEDVVKGVELGLSAGGYEKAAFTAILLHTEVTDDSSSYLYGMCARLITDPNYGALAQAIIAQDIAQMQMVLQSGLATDDIGRAYSSAGTNEVVVNRLDTMLNALSGTDRISLLSALANASDDHLPTLVWKRYIEGDAALSQEAAEALITSISPGKKYPYFTMDFSPYASKLIADLTSGNETLRNNASALIDRVPTNTLHHEFYMSLFNAQPSESLFIIIASHYSGKDALGVGLSMSVNGQAITPQTMSINISSSASNVSSSKVPDFSSQAQSALSYLDVVPVQEGADVALDFNIRLTPRYKLYSGMHSRSYLGAEGSGTLEASQNGSRIATSSGRSLILPPEDKPVSDGTYVYKPNPEDAPLSDAFTIAYIDALYRMWGAKALFALYNYDAANTLEVAKLLWQ